MPRPSCEQQQLSSSRSSCTKGRNTARLVKLALASRMRSHSPSYLVCTPREKGTMSHAPLRFTAALPLLVILPMTRASTALKGSALPLSLPRHCRGGLRKSAAACPGGAQESTCSGSPGRQVHGMAPSSAEALMLAQPRPESMEARGGQEDKRQGRRMHA